MAHSSPSICLTRDCRHAKICPATIYEMFRLEQCIAENHRSEDAQMTQQYAVLRVLGHADDGPYT